jgi:hypothetical protein
MIPLHPSIHSTILLLWGIVIHLVLDWLGQNHWQAENKYRLVGPRRYLPFSKPAPPGVGPAFLLPHPAAFVHSGIHLVGLLLIFPWYAALGIAAMHLLIDMRAPLAWWRGFFRQTQSGEVALHVAIWGDQAAHILMLALVALIVG